MLSNTNKGLTYADAGVDIDAGNKAVELMKDSVKATYRPEVLGDLGGFGGLFSLMNSDIKKPILSAVPTRRHEAAPGHHDGQTRYSRSGLCRHVHQ